MSFDVQKLSMLAQTDANAFERERSRIIKEHIESLPADRQKAAFAFQLELDLKRFHLSSADFLAYCSAKMNENIDRLNAVAKTLACSIAEEVVPSPAAQNLSNVVPFVRRE